MWTNETAYAHGRQAFIQGVGCLLVEPSDPKVREAFYRGYDDAAREEGELMCETHIGQLIM